MIQHLKSRRLSPRKKLTKITKTETTDFSVDEIQNLQKMLGIAPQQGQQPQQGQPKQGTKPELLESLMSGQTTSISKQAPVSGASELLKRLTTFKKFLAPNLTTSDNTKSMNYFGDGNPVVLTEAAIMDVIAEKHDSNVNAQAQNHLDTVLGEILNVRGAAAAPAPAVVPGAAAQAPGGAAATSLANHLWDVNNNRAVDNNPAAGAAGRTKLSGAASEGTIIATLDGAAHTTYELDHSTITGQARDALDNLTFRSFGGADRVKINNTHNIQRLSNFGDKAAALSATSVGQFLNTYWGPSYNNNNNDPRIGDLIRNFTDADKIKVAKKVVSHAWVKDSHLMKQGEGNQWNTANNSDAMKKFANELFSAVTQWQGNVNNQYGFGDQQGDLLANERTQKAYMDNFIMGEQVAEGHNKAIFTDFVPALAG